MHETTLLLIEVGALLLAMSLLGRLALSIGISPIPFYLVLGLAFGNGGFVDTRRERGVLPGGRRDRRHPAARAARTRVHRGRAVRQPQVGAYRGHLRRAAERPARCGHGAAARMGPGGRRRARRRHLGVVVGRHREAAARPRPVVEPRDAGDPRGARDRGPRDGVLPAGALGDRGRGEPAAGRDHGGDRGGRRRRDPLHRAAARALRVATVPRRPVRAAAARRARAHDARRGRRGRGERVGGGRRVPRGHRPLGQGRREREHRADAAARPVRGDLLRLLRPHDRLLGARLGAAAGARARDRHDHHQARHRGVRGPACGCRHARPVARRTLARPARRVLDRHRRSRGRRRRRARARTARHCLRAHHDPRRHVPRAAARRRLVPRDGAAHSGARAQRPNCSPRRRRPRHRCRRRARAVRERGAPPGSRSARCSA